MNILGFKDFIHVLYSFNVNILDLYHTEKVAQFCPVKQLLNLSHGSQMFHTVV